MQRGGRKEFQHDVLALTRPLCRSTAARTPLPRSGHTLFATGLFAVVLSIASVAAMLTVALESHQHQSARSSLCEAMTQRLLSLPKNRADLEAAVGAILDEKVRKRQAAIDDHSPHGRTAAVTRADLDARAAAESHKLGTSIHLDRTAAHKAWQNLHASMHRKSVGSKPLRMALSSSTLQSEHRRHKAPVFISPKLSAEELKKYHKWLAKNRVALHFHPKASFDWTEHVKMKVAKGAKPSFRQMEAAWEMAKHIKSDALSVQDAVDTVSERAQQLGLNNPLHILSMLRGARLPMNSPNSVENLKMTASDNSFADE